MMMIYILIIFSHISLVFQLDVIEDFAVYMFRICVLDIPVCGSFYFKVFKC
jgi:hypothetical protein